MLGFANWLLFYGIILTLLTVVFSDLWNLISKDNLNNTL